MKKLDNCFNYLVHESFSYGSVHICKIQILANRYLATAKRQLSYELECSNFLISLEGSVS